MERPPDTIRSHDPNQLSRAGEPGSPGQSAPGCQPCNGGQGDQGSQHEQGSQGGKGSETNHILDPPVPRKRCCPYDFDSKLCQVVNDRLLCGYNRNIGRPASNNKGVILNGGCRLRGGRLECGYEHGPFTNARRPPGWDEVHNAEPDDDNIVVGNDTLPILQSSASGETGKEPVVLNNAELERDFLKMSIPPHKVHKDSTKKYRSGTKCVEIHERVVCKQI